MTAAIALLLTVTMAILVRRDFFSGRMDTITLVLLPGERSNISGNIIRVPPGRHWIVLSINIGGKASTEYSATIASPEHGEIRRFARLHPLRTARQSLRLSMRLDSALLQTGNYSLMVFPLDENSSLPIGGYSFSVILNHH
ncbi:MAG: hypothetical protein M3Y72_12370 [Acidobacteriota bacterium]|nr:hypothetical protein [Acidobacteriota bacterium]